MSLAALLLCPPAARAHADIVEADAKVAGSTIHYLESGTGPVVILLHGYTQTSRMWRPLIPQLSGTHRVIAPDLPGIGDSQVPPDGLDMKSAALTVHALAESLGVKKASVIGHDIGLMVAYAYAATYPAETEKLALLDAFLPGVAGWEEVYDNPGIWHFRFTGPTPEALVRGRERTYFDHYWNDFAADKARSLSEEDRRAYVAAYSREGRMRSGWAYFQAFPKTARDFEELARTPLSMPVLSIGGDKSLGESLGKQVKLVGRNVEIVVLKDTGHWILEERPKETAAALVRFVDGRP